MYQYVWENPKEYNLGLIKYVFLFFLSRGIKELEKK